jgi:hypothetical protein
MVLTASTSRYKRRAIYPLSFLFQRIESRQTNVFGRMSILHAKGTHIRDQGTGQKQSEVDQRRPEGSCMVPARTSSASIHQMKSQHNS